jgi:serine/threonine protein kinase
VCGDVKPSNVVRFSGGLQRWKLIDLGAAAETGQGVMEFSSSYCSPELAKCFLHGSMARASKCSDVWAYGKIMYEMAVGSPSALLAPVGGDGGEEETRRVLEQVWRGGTPFACSVIWFRV